MSQSAPSHRILKTIPVHSARLHCFLLSTSSKVPRLSAWFNNTHSTHSSRPWTMWSVFFSEPPDHCDSKYGKRKITRDSSSSHTDFGINLSHFPTSISLWISGEDNGESCYCLTAHHYQEMSTALMCGSWVITGTTILGLGQWESLKRIYGTQFIWSVLRCRLPLSFLWFRDGILPCFTGRAGTQELLSGWMFGWHMCTAHLSTSCTMVTQNDRKVH